MKLCNMILGCRYCFLFFLFQTLWNSDWIYMMSNSVHFYLVINIVFFLSLFNTHRKANNNTREINEKIHSFFFLNMPFAFCLCYFSIYTSVVIRPLVLIHSTVSLWFLLVSPFFIIFVTYISITMIKIDRNIFLLYLFVFVINVNRAWNMRREWVQTIKDIKMAR